MRIKNNKHIGSNFDDFLKEEGIYEEVKDMAFKEMLVMDLKKVLMESHINKSILAKRMSTSRSEVDRILDPQNESVNIATLNKVAHAIGKKLEVRFV